MKTPIHVYDAPNKNLMLAFQSETIEETIAANTALERLMKELGLNPFHQIGTRLEGNNVPGFHAWECWSHTTEDFLVDMIPHVNEYAAELMEKML